MLDETGNFPTDTWASIYVETPAKKIDTECKESLQEGVKKVYRKCKESLHNNNNINNNNINNNNNIEKQSFPIKAQTTVDSYIENTKKEAIENLYKDYMLFYPKESHRYAKKALTCLYIEQLIKKEFTLDTLRDAFEQYKREARPPYIKAPQYFFGNSKQ